MPTKPTTNNLEGWREKLIEKQADKWERWGLHWNEDDNLQFISELRKQDEEELIKMLPKKYIPLPNDEKDKMFCHVRNICFEDCKQLIKDYYNNK